MLKKITIFITDDDTFWCNLLHQILNELGYLNITTFNNSADCLNNLHLNPKLVFLDYHIDDMNGIEILQKIKKNNSDTGVIFCTANEDLKVVVNAMKMGSFDYLIKSEVTKQKIDSIITEMSDRQIFAEKVF